MEDVKTIPCQGVIGIVFGHKSVVERDQGVIYCSRCALIIHKPEGYKRETEMVGERLKEDHPGQYDIILKRVFGDA